MRMMTRRHFAPAVLLLATAAALVAQEAQAPKPQAAKPQAPPEAAETPTFPAQVEQVIVDTVVTDKKGGVDPGSRSARTSRSPRTGSPRRSRPSRRWSCRSSRPPTPPPPPKVTLNTTPEERRGRTFVHPLRRHEHHAVPGEPGEGGGRELPREGHPRGRPGDPRLERRGRLVERPDGVGAGRSCSTW